MGYLLKNGTTASGKPPVDPQEFTKCFVLFPQTGKLMKWEVQGNCFSVSLQRLIQTVAIAVVGALELLALPFRAALFFSCGLCADQVTIIGNQAPKITPLER